MAEIQRVHVLVRRHVVVALIRPVVVQIRQLTVLVGMQVERLLHQLAGELIGRALVIAAEDLADALLTAVPHGDALTDIARCTAKGVRHGKAAAALVVDAEDVLAETGKLLPPLCFIQE